MQTFLLNAKEIYLVGKDKPYKTISSALLKMKDGDTCIINEGVYRETINIKLNNITLKGQGKVVITGCDSIGKMQTSFLNGQKIQKKFIGKPVYDVFQDNNYLSLSRYPNKVAAMTSNIDWKKSEIKTDGTIKFDKKLHHIYDGYYLGIHNKGNKLKSWYSITVPIKKIDKKGFLHVEEEEASSGFLGKYGIGKGLGYIIGSKTVLDAKGEWYADKEYVYIIPLSDIAKTYEVRVRLYGMTILSNGVDIENIHFKAASAWIKGNHATLKKCTFEYISPFMHTANNKPKNKRTQSLTSCWGTPKNDTSGVFVSGDNFFAEDCIFSKSWWAGMTLRGNHATIQNCLFENLNWMAKRSAGLFSWGNYNKVRFCTFKNLGGSAIEGGNASWVKQYAKNNIWEFNYIENVCTLIVDQGFFYINHQSGKNPKANSIWRYNVGRGARGPQKGSWTKNTVGLYLDNSSSGYRIHNNIVIDANEGIHYNDSKDGVDAGRDVLFYNNIFYNCDSLVYNVFKNGKSDANVTLINNLLVSCPTKALKSWKRVLKSKKNIEVFNSLLFKSPVNMNLTPTLRKYIKNIIPNESINNAKYIGAVNPEKGMWKYGADVSKLLP